MDNEVRWRYGFECDLVGALPRFPGLCAAVIGGAVARVYSDPYSDIELLLFWERARPSFKGTEVGGMRSHQCPLRYVIRLAAGVKSPLGQRYLGGDTA
jgi:hypothetical protein